MLGLRCRIGEQLGRGAVQLSVRVSRVEREEVRLSCL